MICLTLRNLDFDWQVAEKSDCKLKCRTRLENEPIQNDEKAINEFLSYKFLRVDISIFKEPNQEEV